MKLYLLLRTLHLLSIRRRITSERFVIPAPRRPRMSIDRFVANQCRGARATLLWRMATAGVLCSAGVSLPALAEVAGADADLADSASSTGGTLEEVTVTAERLELLGSASTASEGVVAAQELQLAPQYRPGQLLETRPRPDRDVAQRRR